MNRDIKILLKQIDEERGKKIFLDCLRYPVVESITDKPAVEILLHDKINWENLQLQEKLTGFLPIAQCNIISTIKLLQIVSDQCCPELFDQVIIGNCGLNLLTLKLEANNSNRIIYIDMFEFNNKLNNYVKSKDNSDTLTRILIIGVVGILTYLLIDI